MPRASFTSSIAWRYALKGQERAIVYWTNVEVVLKATSGKLPKDELSTYGLF